MVRKLSEGIDLQKDVTHRLLRFGTTWHRSSGTCWMAALSILMRVRAEVPFRLGKVSTARASEIILEKRIKK